MPLQTLTTQTEEIEIPKFDMGAFLHDEHSYVGLSLPNWAVWIIIFLFVVYIYNKVFRARKLPLLKDLVVYVLMLFGSFVLLIFQADAGLPIVYSLGVAVLMMLIVRIRVWLEGRTKKQR